MLWFKEVPEKRRGVRDALCNQWFGSKSARGWMEEERGVGLLKRYGKITRTGMPQLRLQEFTLLRTGGAGAESIDDRKGVTLFCVYTDTQRPQSAADRKP